MTITTVVRRNPALTYATSGMVLWILLWGVHVELQGSGLKAAVLALGEVLLFPALAVQDAIFALTGGEAIPWHGGISILAGLALCLIADAVYRRARARFRS